MEEDRSAIARIQFLIIINLLVKKPHFALDLTNLAILGNNWDTNNKWHTVHEPFQIGVEIWEGTPL